MFSYLMGGFVSNEISTWDEILVVSGIKLTLNGYFFIPGISSWLHVNALLISLLATFLHRII